MDSRLHASKFKPWARPPLQACCFQIHQVGPEVARQMFDEYIQKLKDKAAAKAAAKGGEEGEVADKKR